MKRGNIKKDKKLLRKKTKPKKKIKKPVKTKRKKQEPKKKDSFIKKTKDLITQKKSGLLGEVIKRQSDKKRDRAGTGISNFDKMVSGGFERESINLIAGGSGSGKSIFALQFLMEGVKKGEKVLYITFEEKKEEFYENMKKIGWI